MVRIKFIRFVLCIFLTALFTSCGVTKELRTIQAYQETSDVKALLRSISEHPKYRSSIEYSLFNDIDYTPYSYGTLKEFSELAGMDIEASLFFDSLLVDRQTRTIDSLSVLSIEDVADFYREKGQEHDYLRNELKNSCFSDIAGMDYQSRKLLNNAFSGTDLYPLINGPYTELRDSLLAEIFSVWDSYFRAEESMLDDIEEVVREECQEYIESGLATIMEAVLNKNDRTFLKKIFKRQAIDDYSFEQYVNSVINDAFDPAVVQDFTIPRLSEYLETSSRMRLSIFNEYFDKTAYSGLEIDSEPLASELEWRIGRGEVSRMQDIKDTGNVLSAGSFLLGFIPGIGALAFAADVADFAYGMSQNSKEQSAIQGISDAIYNDSLASVGAYLSDVFGRIRDSRRATENNIHSIFERDF